MTTYRVTDAERRTYRRYAAQLVERVVRWRRQIGSGSPISAAAEASLLQVFLS